MTHSFPTRRSSDLESDRLPVDPATARLASGHPARWSLARACAGRGRAGGGRGRGNDGAARPPGRILSDSSASGIAVQSGPFSQPETNASVLLVFHSWGPDAEGILRCSAPLAGHPAALLPSTTQPTGY